jgi:hypothetical protein
MSFVIDNPTNTILREIAMPEMTQKSLAKMYAMLLKQRDEVEWALVNHAIIDRWSRKGLERIKTAAWRYAGC